MRSGRKEGHGTAGGQEPARAAARAPCDGRRASRREPLLNLTLRIGALLAGAVALEIWFMRITRLTEPSYARPVILVELVAGFTSARPLSLFTLTVIALATGAALRARALGPRWEQFEHAARLRGLIGLVTFLLAWTYATYGYNYYFDQAHHLDRLLLLALVPLVVWRPVFVFPFLLVLLPVIWQFAHPIGGFSWAAPILLVRVVLLFGALWLARASIHRGRTADFVFLLACLIASHYWVSGYGKLQLGWLTRDQIGLLLPATYANGWLGFLGPDSVSELTRAVLRLNWPLKIGTILIECGALFALRSRGTLRLFLFAWITLHGGIVMLTGIVFWKWMVLEAAVLLLFFANRGADLPIFTRPHFLLSIVLIGGGAFWFRPAPLAWLDSRVSYTYRLEALGESGRTYFLSPRFFAPYDYQFTLSGFRYLTATPHLPVTWGATHRRDLHSALEHSTAPSEVLALESRMGLNAFDPERSATYDHFTRRFTRTWGEHDRTWRWWTPLQAPPLLWTFPRGAPPEPADPLVRVVVYQVVSLFDGESYLEIRKQPVRVIVLQVE